MWVQWAAGYKTNLQKPVVFQYTKNKLSEKDMKKAIPFTISSKRIKYLGINLTKEVKDHTENCKTLTKEITEDSNKWKDILYSWITKVVKMSRLPKVI